MLSWFARLAFNVRENWKSNDKGRTSSVHLSLLLLVDLVYDMIWDCFVGQMHCGSLFCSVVNVHLVLSSVHFCVLFLHYHDSLALVFCLGFMREL